MTESIAHRLRRLRAALVMLLCAALALAGCARMHTPAAADAGRSAQTATAIDISAVPPRRAPSALPAGWHHGAFMEIFVRAYADSDGDGIGDLRGLISRLDYLQALGVKGLWLMPITASADRDHGYATTDFRAIERDYGTLADFDELIAQAHARGIGVVMDYVINHSAAEHPMFRAARHGPGSPWRDWYVWLAEAPTGWDIWGKNPWYAAPEGGHYFGTFGAQMPDFNFRNPRVVDYHLDSLRFWLNRGLDGFRLDAVPHLIENSAREWNDQPESRQLTRRLQDLIKSYPNRYAVCEATASPQAYGDAQVCGAAFAFGHVQHYVEAARGKPAAVAALAAYFAQASPNMATFVSNHDIFAGARLWDQVGGDEAMYRLAAAGYLLQPGTPFIYYGEEVGQAGVAQLPGMNGDRSLRAPMSWTADADNAGFTRGLPFRPVAPNVATHNAQAQQGRADSILAFYRAMLRLRNQQPSIARGSFEQAFADGLVLGFQRRAEADHTLVLINYGRAGSAVQVPALPAGARLQPLYPEGGVAQRVGGDGRATLELPAQAVRVWRLVAGG